MTTHRILGLLASLFIFSSTWSQTIVTDRPDQTESSTAIPQGAFQWECGISSTWTPGFGGTQRDIALPNSLFRLGLHPQVELRIVHELGQSSLLGWGAGESASQGTSDLQVGAKVQLWSREGSFTELAYLGHAVLPTGNESFTNYELGMVHKLCVSHDLGSVWAVGYNVGADLLSGRWTATYAFSVARSVNDQLGVYIEPYGEWDLRSGYQLTSLDAGFTWLSSDQWQWDFSFGLGVNHEMNYTAVGFSWLVLRD